MTKEEWLSSPKTIEKSRKPYAHFDFRCDITSCASYISDPSKISTHSFYPFIHYEKDMTKYSGKSGPKPEIFAMLLILIAVSFSIIVSS